MKRFLFSIVLLLCCTAFVQAQGWPDHYGGVMLQGFYWDSYTDSQWATLEKQADDLASSFDLLWIPQSGFCGSQSMGYDDLWWFNNYNSSFGNEQQLRSMIKTLKAAGVATIADVVINHRRNVSNWVDFPKETYKGETYEMVSTDIVANDDGGETKKWAEKNGYSLSKNNDTGEGWGGMRDLDHKSENVQRIVKAYLDFLLNDLGYSGFRYDMVKGYSASFTKMYNESAKPMFSVGECWDGTGTIRRWIDGTDKTSAAFDFQFRYAVRNAANNGDWSRLQQQNDGNWPLVSNNYEKGAYRQWAVTFVENHDTEYRSATAQQDPLKKDTLAANAYMLAMPGTPCVFLKHWQDYKPAIKAMIEARKLAGINNMSNYSNFKSHARYYADLVDEKLLVVVGDEKQVVPDASLYTRILSGHHYAYYLSNKAETAWVDQASGDFGEAFSVTLTAVTEKAGAKLVYTTDGSMPTATNGKQVESGATITIDATTTLHVGLLVGGAVSGIVSRTFTYREAEPEPTVAIPSFCQVTPGEVCAFFESPATWGNTIHCWAWSDQPSDNFTYANKNWPGVACQLLGTADDGNRVWKWTWDGTKQKNSSATMPAMIIFNNNGQPQTKDMPFDNGGYYTESGLMGNVAADVTVVKADNMNDTSTSYDLQGRRITTSSTNDAMRKVYVRNGRKYVK